MNTRKRKLLALAALLGLVGALTLLFFFPPGQYPFYPRCLLHALTGLQCPACGGLRATSCLLHGDFAGAFRLNPLFVVLLSVFSLIAIARVAKQWTGHDCLRFIRRPIWLWLLAAAVLLFSIGRNL